MASKFSRLVRFRNPRGTLFYGETGDEVLGSDEMVGRKVKTFTGQLPWDDDFLPSGDEEEICQIVSPLPSAPIVYGVGLNYRSHANEAGAHLAAPGNYPIVFTKPPDALAGPLDDVPFSEELQQLDYEGELCLIIGKTLKYLGEDEDPAPYILGYTVGNDVSSRFWQSPTQSGGQHAVGKSFDKFAPIGPVIVAPATIPRLEAMRIRTLVNGEERQNAAVGDMIFDIKAILRFLSRGVTLRPGTVIMTGTPSGVAAFMDPPQWLRDGDTVEVSISEIGAIRNMMVLDKARKQ